MKFLIPSSQPPSTMERVKTEELLIGLRYSVLWRYLMVVGLGLTLSTEKQNLAIYRIFGIFLFIYINH
jgi:hypothetical protein